MCRRIVKYVARCLTRADSGLLRLTATSAASVHLALGLGIRADVLEGRSVTVVGVDACEFATVDRGDALNVDVALALLGAVSAGAVQLSIVLDVEVDDVHRTTAVMLDNLIRSVVRTTTNDPRLVASDILLDGDGILTDIFEPDELKRAGALTVDTLGLVLADNAVSKSCALFKEEDSVGGSLIPC